MNTAEQLSYSLSKENYNYNEINIGKFKEFAKKFILVDSDVGSDKYYLIKANTKFNQIELPEDLSEYFIYYNEFAKFLVLNTKFSRILHKAYNINLQKMPRTNPQKMIYEYYYKWVFNDSTKDNRYFALSVLKQIKESRKNALNLIIQGSILANEKHLMNVQKSLESFDEAEQILALKNFEINELSEIKYYIYLFKGFVQLIDQNYEGAKYEFLQALSQKSNGISAKFHLAIAELFLSNTDVAKSLVNEAIDYDIQLMQICIETNKINDFNYFVRNFVSKNYFNDSAFYTLLDVFENRINDLLSSAQVRFVTLKEDLLLMKEIKFGEMHEPEIYRSLEFIEEFVKTYQNSENLLILESIAKVEQKFVSTLKNILNNIEGSYKREIEESLKIYDIKIGENSHLKVKIQGEFELQKKRLEDKLKSTINDYSLIMDEKIKSMEMQAANLEAKPEYNPLSAFKNSISYTLFLSLLVLLLAGFAEYSNSSVDEITEATKVLTIVLFEGSKWGIVSFVIGIFISLMVAASTSMEKSGAKQRMEKTISILKNEKLENIKNYKEEFERAIKDNEQIYKNRVESIDIQVKELQEKKKHDEVVMIEKAASRVSKETTKLKEIIEHYN